jgi:hypothetical protein
LDFRQSTVGLHLRHFKRPLQYRDMRRRYYGGGLDANRCIFVHVPKTGGVSIAQSLFGSQVGGHRTAMDYRVIFGPRLFGEYFKFAFVRHPVDRLVSAFWFLKSGGMHAEDAAWARANLDGFDTVDDFVNRWLTPESAAGWRHFRPQRDYVCDHDGRLLVDFVGRFEQIDADFAVVAERLRIEAILMHANSSGSSRPHGLSPAGLAVVERVYRADYRLFGYEPSDESAGGRRANEPGEPDGQAGS